MLAAALGLGAGEAEKAEGEDKPKLEEVPIGGEAASEEPATGARAARRD